MEFKDTVRSRRMVRRYLTTPIEADVVERILEAGRRAPSAGNARGTHFVVVTDPANRQAIARSADEEAWVDRGKPAWLSPAPVHIVVAAMPDAYLDRYAAIDKAGSAAVDDAGRWPVPWWWVDAGAALMALLLAAVEEGLAAGFLGGHAFDGLEDVVGLPPRAELVGLVTLGHPHPGDRPTGSGLEGPAPTDEVVHYERWDAR